MPLPNPKKVITVQIGKSAPTQQNLVLLVCKGIHQIVKKQLVLHKMIATWKSAWQQASLATVRNLLQSPTKSDVLKNPCIVW